MRNPRIMKLFPTNASKDHVSLIQHLGNKGCTVLRAPATSPCAPCFSAGPGINRIEFGIDSCLAPGAFFTFKFDLDARTLNNKNVCLLVNKNEFQPLKSNSSNSSRGTVFRKILSTSQRVYVSYRKLWRS